MKAAIFIVASLFFMGIFSVSTHAAPQPLISELQTGGCVEFELNDPSNCAVDAPANEFIELYNPQTVDLDMDGWKLEYVRPASNMVLAELKGKLSPDSHLLVSAEGFLAEADFHFPVSNSGMLAKSGGLIRVIDANGQVVDALYWGNRDAEDDWPKVEEIPVGYSAKRLKSGNYEVSQPSTPVGGGYVEKACQGVVLSEILPNPAGPDSGKEFIEIYNPTSESISLEGCSFTVGSTLYDLPMDYIAAGEYRAFFDTATNITLPNQAGGMVTLTTSELEESVTYPGELGDDVAWARVDNALKETYKPTPNAVNELVQEEPSTECPAGKVYNPETGNCVADSSSGLKPCAEGYERNPSTNRCRAVGGRSSDELTSCEPGQERSSTTNRCRSVARTANSLVPCKPGQERNPETNRCRSAQATTASLPPCASDQVRNPETNRCKKVASSEGPKPCPAGQERNPSTNRCRKVVEDSNPTHSVEKTGADIKSQYGWWIAGAAGTGVLGYGAYEWRRELSEGLSKLRSKFFGGKNDPPLPPQ